MHPTTCNGCGSCCEPVVLGYTQAEAWRLPLEPDERRWVIEDLTPLPGSHPLVRAALEWMDGAAVWGGSPVRFFYRCRHFDADTRRCDDWDHRPAPCRTYPWPEGDEPLAGACLPPACSFRADLGQPVALGPTRST